MFLILALIGCTETTTIVHPCPYDNPIRDTGGTVFPTIPLNADPAAYQCTGDLGDCTPADIAIGSRGWWEAECVQDDEARPLLLVEWVVL